MAKSLPATRSLTIMFLTMMIVAVSVVVGSIAYFTHSSTQQIARDNAKRHAELTFEGLYSTMRQGGTAAEMEEILSRFMARYPDFQMQVVRSQYVDELFGLHELSKQARENDQLIALALKNKAENFEIKGKNARYLYPIPVSQECLQCHTNVAIGDINGLIELRFPTSAIQEPIEYVIGRVLIVLGIIFGALLIAVIAFVRFAIARPLEQLAMHMTSLNDEQWISQTRFLGMLWSREVVILRERFNGLMGSLSRTRKELEDKTRELETTVTSLHTAKISLERQSVEIATLAHEQQQLNTELQHEVSVKNRFFSILAHDLKSPFNALLGQTQMMEHMAKDMSKEQLSEYARDVNHSGNKVFLLLQNLLEWAQMQMSGEKLVSQTLNTQTTVTECIDLNIQAAADKQLKLVDETQPLWVEADPDALKTVIRNLISNAIKFTPDGGSVTISNTDLGRLIEIRVRDTGVGMSPEQIKSVFALDVKTTTIGTAGELGTGLGLPLCKDLVHASGGHIHVESTLGEGSIFSFTLPASKAQ